MPKKAAKNGFFFYMLEWKQRAEASGRKTISMQQVQEQAGPSWAAMNAAQRAPYLEKAKQSKLNGGNGVKLTSLGIPVSQIDAERREKEEHAASIITRLKAMLETASQNDTLESLDFYIISFAYFCVNSDGDYLPAEMAVVRFNLKDGVHTKLHMLINPGSLPLGMAYDAQQHANEDHQLPTPPDALGESDFDIINHKLLQFLGYKNGQIPLLFTERDDVAKVENMLQGIFGVSVTKDQLCVGSLADMFYHLKRATEKHGLDAETFGSVHRAQLLITKDIYDYTIGIACDFHEANSNVKNCALSRCVRWGYVIADNCCMDLCIELQPGKHVPTNADTTSQYATPAYSCNTSMSGAYDQDDKSFVSYAAVSQLTTPSYGGSSLNSGDRRVSSTVTSNASTDTKVDVKRPVKLEYESPLSVGEPTPKQQHRDCDLQSNYAWSAVSGKSSASRGRGRGLILNDSTTSQGIGRGNLLK
ncbi:protein maelstrom homolog [Anopheles aquasalis]|uniref:protein maelstrom homolog n=1 Tax=Anopheles aquasalis TaxID=42839 RepID=UPI00215B65BE|nr:protein maelstrom homolog [Anopheles aquasalis]